MKHLRTVALAAAATLTILMLASSAVAQTASAPSTSASAPDEPSTSGKPSSASGDAMSGVAAWYGSKFNKRKTASGQRFNSGALTAAHPSLSFGSRVKVTNTKNNRSVVVVINDRGPTSPGRIIDVSQAAAKRLGFIRAGLTDVKLKVVGQSKVRRSVRNSN